MKKIVIIIVILVGTLILSSCTTVNDLESVGLAGLTGKEILTKVADGSIKADGYGLSVHEDELLILFENNQVSLPMPKDEFYLSVAPYIDQTHDCYYHSATGCRGELKEQEFFVEFKDIEGNVILSENMTSLSNGFIDLWLPRNIEGTLTITFNNLESSKIISTVDNAPTCETTMKLK